MDKKKQGSTVWLRATVMDHIQAHGKFGETVDDVLRRLLGLPDGEPKEDSTTTDKG
jgi:hypothetical protein